MIKGIEHTAIASADPHRLADWYVAHLDFVINYRSSRSKTVFVKAFDGYMIEIIEAEPGTTPAEGMKAAGFRHLALAVDDFDATYARLVSKGVAFLTEPERASGNTIAFFRDCDGNILHLLHREKPLP
ncbi:MAG TPA: VOC family protein [Candidatus Acidoferrales bacterium]|nr:VOC family protein [Candidatus Acidoferrales bacterium]HTS61013.1 VOC family protein [Candidatus Acidoferrales bacterium]